MNYYAQKYDSVAHYIKNFLIYTGNIQDRRKLRMYLFHTSNCPVVQFTNQKVGSESQYHFQGHPADFFRGAARSRALLGSKITSLHHTAQCMFCHTAAAETEQGTHYSIFEVWILEVVTQVIFTERIQFTE